jgi:isoleucyl-tRNA synthetase
MESPIPELVGAHAVIWTTTPWTIPVNQAIAYGAEVDYVLLRGNDGKKCLVAYHLTQAFLDRIEASQTPEQREAQDKVVFHPNALQSIARMDASVIPAITRHKGSQLAGTVARHPMHHLGGFFARPRPFLDGSAFVTTDSGTGLVHMAPDHGEDDFDLCKSAGIEPVFAVEGDGKYRDDWGWLPGQGSVINPKFNAPDGPICSDLRAAGALLAASADYRHSYPHSWRSKAKVIYRCTPQWFVPMDRPIAASGTLRETALQAIADTRFVPDKGRNRIGAMVEGRPDWVLSRQRAWGVPITLFVKRGTNQYLDDPAVNARIVAGIRAGGVDAWSDERAQEYLGAAYRAEDYERVTDILDVWFDSGSTHAFVLESGRWPELRWPADLYLEGSDQHRGWFQSSLLESCATRGRAPYNAVLTHGFTMDSKGFKMSKSLGNTIDPLKVMETNGADIIRLWALSVDYTEDHRIGDEILKGVADQYRKLRNTFRYLLGALDGFDYEREAIAAADMPELERWVLDRLSRLDATLRGAIDGFDFNEYVRALVDFANEDLSAFYFDVRKDSLYCDAPADTRRRACRTVFDILFQALVRYASPVLVFTAEEVWATRFPDRGSIHLETFRPLPAEWRDDALAARIEMLRALRTQVTEAIEPLRRDKIVRSGLEAEVTAPASAVPEGISPADLAELFITGTVRVGEIEGVEIFRTEDHKCGRCWRHLPEVTEDGALCSRCDHVVAGMDAAA